MAWEGSWAPPAGFGQLSALLLGGRGVIRCGRCAAADTHANLIWKGACGVLEEVVEILDLLLPGVVL